MGQMNLKKTEYKIAIIYRYYVCVQSIKQRFSDVHVFVCGYACINVFVAMP